MNDHDVEVVDDPPPRDSIGRDGKAYPSTRRRAIAEHLALIFGDPDDPATGDGWAFLGLGHDPVLTDTGAVQYDRWSERPYRWPAQAAELVAAAAEVDADAFVTPCRAANPLRDSVRRRPLPVAWCWADVDGPTADTEGRAELLVARGAVRVASGSAPERFHLYVPLDEPTDPATVEHLNRRLAAWLGGDPAVGRTNGVLRLAGSVNRKPIARGDAPASVVLTPGNGATVSTADLDELLPDAPPPASADVDVPEAEEVPDEDVPAEVAELLGEAVTDGMDRSARTHALVGACYRAGLSAGQTVELAGRHAPTVSKYGPRLAREVARCWAKIKAAADDEAAWLDSVTPSVGGAAEAPQEALAGAVDTFRRWLHLPDLAALHGVLGAFVANHLPGDPCWLLLVGPPSSGKTEVLNALARRAGVHPVATLTEGALLSGTPKKDATGKGGLLRHVGDFGVLLLKDFTSVLAQNKDTRSAVLAALREIYDGAWTRHLGTDGGRTLHWEGKLGLIGGCTPTIDRHHAVLSALGDRFLLLRLPSVDAEEVGARAMAHLGHEPAMRAELAAAAGRVLDAADLAAAGRTLDPDEHRRLLDLAIFAVRARSAVERDGYSQEVLAIPEAEGPPRFLLALRRLMGGLESIGCGPEDVWHVLTAVAVDSMPATRRRLLEALMVTGRARTGELAAAADLPTKTAARHLEDLALLGLATRTKTSTATNAPDEWTPSDLARRYWPRSATEIPKEEQRTGTAAGGPFTHPSPQKKECLSYSPSPAAELLCEVCGETPGDNAPECPACAEVVPA